MITFSKRKCIIKKAIKETIAAFDDRTPGINDCFFYGAFELAPHSLAIWYIFETNDELETAKTSGLCSELEEKTVKNLISSGYPKEAFKPAETDFSADKIVIQDSTDKDVQHVFDSLSNRKATVSFTSQEDIDEKANGDYHLYFQ